MKCCSSWMRLTRALLKVLVCAPQLGVLTSPSASHVIIPHSPLHHTHTRVISPHNSTPQSAAPVPETP